MKLIGYTVRKTKNIWGYVPFWEPNPKYIWGFVPMPRPQRPDRQPTIYMRDVSTSTQLARQAVEDDLEVIVHERGEPQYYYRTYNKFHYLLRALREYRENINFSVLFVLIENIEMASVRPMDAPPDANGRSPFRLVQPGCRANLRQRDIADELKCSIETVRTAIKKLRECEIIVNWGHGWFELDADFFWKGSEAVRRAYTTVQRKRREN